MINLIEISKSEEMFIEDQDEDVEEEEEFHEVEEEKHKTSQESVGAEAKSPLRERVKSTSVNKDSEVTADKPKNDQASSEDSVDHRELNNDLKSDETNVVVADEAKIPEPVESSPPETQSEDTTNESDNKELTSDEAVKNSDSIPEAVSNDHTDPPQAAGEDQPPPSSDEDDVKSSEAPTIEEAKPTVKEEETEEKSEQKVDEKHDETDEIKTEEAKNTDWADLMLSNNQSTEDQDTKEADRDDQPAPDEEGPAKVEEGENEEKDDKAAETDKKELDLDEDVKNPQYIPKKGVFYEHDDRSHDTVDHHARKVQPSSASTKVDDESTESKDSSNNKKSNSTQEKQGDMRRGSRRQRTETDRWNHDLFRDEKQKPKSKSELINAYGFDIRHERTSRNQADNRLPRGNNSNTTERQQINPDNQRPRRNSRQNQSSNRSGDRRSRRVTNNRNGTSVKRDVPNSRPIKQDTKDVSEVKRDQQDASRDKNTRVDGRSRRQNSRDRPAPNSTEDKLPPINTVMPPITTWSNKIEDMVKEEATRKESPSRHHQQHVQGSNNNAKSRSNDFWPQNHQNKNIYHDRTIRNMDDRHQQHFNTRRYQDREEGNKPPQNRNHYNDRSNQHHQEWRRNNHYNNLHAKSNEYEPIKTQTFENSRLAQANMNRSNFRDAREIINERRMQHNFQLKAQPGSSGSEQGQVQHHNQHQQQHQHQQLVQPHQQIIQHQNQQLLQHQQAPQHMRQIPSSSSPQRSTQNQPHQQPNQHLSTQAQQQLQNQQIHNPRQQQVPQTQHPTQPRQNLVMNNNLADGVHESSRLNTTTANSNELINSRPIIKTDSYTGTSVAPGSQQPQALQQHSHNHRSIGGPMSQQQVPSSAGSHMLPSHLNAGGTQAQYYTQSGSSRDSAAAAAALATAYHGYIPSGHSVLDATRYHMTSQQLSEHGYIATPGQGTEVAPASVMHPQGLYTDAASAGGTVASSAYLAQAGSTLSPSTNIPVTGAGPPPLAPVSYLQHSQYPPPPYSNPYSQPQHNQTPPQSSHAYQYWTYI